MKKHTKTSDCTVYLSENTLLGIENSVASTVTEPFPGIRKILQLLIMLLLRLLLHLVQAFLRNKKIRNRKASENNRINSYVYNVEGFITLKPAT